jgi:hypothetical protein
VAKIAKAAGMTRDTLYKTLAAGGRPRFTSINSLLKVFEIDLLAAAVKTINVKAASPPWSRCLGLRSVSWRSNPDCKIDDRITCGFVWQTSEFGAEPAGVKLKD